MKIIYCHGLDSSAESVKGLLLEDYCRKHHPNIQVLRPDLNFKPSKVFDSLCAMVDVNDHSVVLMGSSLGGYFSTLVSNRMHCPAVLLNPSTQPHISLQRFVDCQNLDLDNVINKSESVVYTTSGGWSITLEDLAWFDKHQLTSISAPNKIYALIKAGDELLNPNIALDFYQSRGVEVNLQQGGNHRMTDFEDQLPMIMEQIIK